MLPHRPIAQSALWYHTLSLLQQCYLPERCHLVTDLHLFMLNIRASSHLKVFLSKLQGHDLDRFARLEV